MLHYNRGTSKIDRGAAQHISIMHSKRNAARTQDPYLELLVESIQLIKEVFHSGKDVLYNSSKEDHGRRCQRSRLNSDIAEVCGACADADGFATVGLCCLEAAALRVRNL